MFLKNIRENWKKGGKPHTHLTPEQMEAIEQLDWFTDVLARWRKGWEGPGKRLFSPADRVRWVLQLCHDERPKQKAIMVPHELTESEFCVTFNPGKFLFDVQGNWKEGGRPKTRLSQEQMGMLQQLAWFPDVLARWKKAWEDPAGRRQPVGRKKSASGRGDHKAEAGVEATPA